MTARQAPAVPTTDMPRTVTVARSPVRVVCDAILDAGVACPNRADEWVDWELTCTDGANVWVLSRGRLGKFCSDHLEQARVIAQSIADRAEASTLRWPAS